MKNIHADHHQDELDVLFFFPSDVRGAIKLFVTRALHIAVSFSYAPSYTFHVCCSIFSQHSLKINAHYLTYIQRRDIKHPTTQSGNRCANLNDFGVQHVTHSRIVSCKRHRKKVTRD